MKSRLLTLLCLSAAACMILFALDRTSANPNHHKNGFSRNFLQGVVKDTEVAPFDNHFRSVCGYDANSIYLETAIPGQIIKCGYNFADPDTIQLTLPYIKNIRPAFTTVVQYPAIYIAAGNANTFVRGDLASNISVISTVPFRFRRGAYIDSSKVLMEVFEEGAVSKFLVYNLYTNEIVKERYLFGRSKNTGLSYDGIFEAEQLSGQYFFLSYYSNQAYCLDSGLNSIFQAHTIDTNNSPKASIVQRGANSSQSTSATFVNNTFSVSGEFIYVLSNLKADNQKENEDIVMDVYLKDNFGYIGSCIVPRYDRERLSAIRVIKNNLYMLYEKHLIRHTLDTKIFKDLLQ